MRGTVKIQFPMSRLTNLFPLQYILFKLALVCVCVPMSLPHALRQRLLQLGWINSDVLTKGIEIASIQMRLNISCLIASSLILCLQLVDSLCYKMYSSNVVHVNVPEHVFVRSKGQLKQKKMIVNFKSLLSTGCHGYLLT